MRSIFVILVLCSVIILGGILRFYGADWGVPKPPYWRNHFQDEAFVAGLLFKMGPNNLNPHYFINPTFHYYTILFSLKIASSLNYIKPFSLPVKTNKLGQPIAEITMDDYSKMYSVGRFVSIVESIILILIIFLIGRNLYNEKVGLLAAAFTSILPTLAYQSHFFVVDAAGVFWLVLAFFFLTTKMNSKKMMRWFIVAGIFIGLAVGTKYTNILLVLPFLYKVYTTIGHKRRVFLKKIVNKFTLTAAGVAIITLFFTTPYSLFSIREFLHGDVNGFGGIFGVRGLFHYNAYPTNFITPFTLSTFHSLRLPLTIFALLGLAYLIYKRKQSDLFLLFFIGSFYLMLIYHASPHLRHVLPVLPFLMIAMARMFGNFLLDKRYKVLKLLTLVVVLLIFIYTFLYSLAFIKRMTPIDTRIECAEWVKASIPKDASIGLSTYFPWNYTPPIEMVTENIVLIGFNYQNLLARKPNYFIITEHELREFPYARESKFLCKKFIKELFSENRYKIIKTFKKDFEIFGIRFSPNFPNMDWNQVNPVIYIFALRDTGLNPQ